ncbi:MAG: serine/threonine protein kinase [Acidobacteria bacterium]|nr:serine/threonine protein kinase [Acidobacteriota bacterium]
MPQLSVAYGLVIQADRFLPGAFPADPNSNVNLRVWLDAMPAWQKEALQTAQIRHVAPHEDDAGEPVLQAWDLAGGEYLRLLYADGTEFILDRRGTQLWVTWPSWQTLEDMATYLLGPVLGLVLRLREVTCLHASAVVVNGKAIALVGASGAGKSTTAAAFAKAGYKVLADDIVALDERSGAFWVRPAYPRVRLWEDSVEALFGAEDALPLLTPTWDKRYLDLLNGSQRFQSEPLPLAAVYLLDERSAESNAPFVEALPDNQKVMTLVANTYANYLLDKSMRAAEFASLGRLCRQIPLRKVTPHADAKFLPELCRVIAEDIHAQSSSELVCTA